ncbi:MAG: AAA family ATPase [Planctomycetales bacterium]|nr:AAA family ATPase [Planctomycetales bacterium]
MSELTEADPNVTSAAPVVGISPERAEEHFRPRQPNTLKEAGLSPNDLESLLLKFILNVSNATGRKAAEQICMPFGIVQLALAELKAQRFVQHRGAAEVSDYVYELTDTGIARARHHLENSTYFGSAPVTLDDYCKSVNAQSLRNYRVDVQHLYDAFDGLSYEPILIVQVGQAINSGRGLFLYGPPGNGKTSVAERVMRACSEEIWIPRTISVTGELIRVFDPSYHELVEQPRSESLLDESHDRRWVRIRRPTVVVGGELTMEHLEMSTSVATGVNEAPVQMKSNCGALVVDDFGRQRVGSTALLNRWIVPLEKGFDHLTLRSGRQIRVPFDQLLVFATNLEPKDVADEAFLRRMPFKVEMRSPNKEQFVELLKQTCSRMKIECCDGAIERLLAVHYEGKNRPLRYCHPRDLLEQVRSFCEFQQIPLQLTEKTVDVAAYNYFAGL